MGAPGRARRAARPARSRGGPAQAPADEGRDQALSRPAPGRRAGRAGRSRTARPGRARRPDRSERARKEGRYRPSTGRACRWPPTWSATAQAPRPDHGGSRMRPQDAEGPAGAGRAGAPPPGRPADSAPARSSRARQQGRPSTDDQWRGSEAAGRAAWSTCEPGERENPAVADALAPSTPQAREVLTRSRAANAADREARRPGRRRAASAWPATRGAPPAYRADELGRQLARAAHRSEPEEEDAATSRPAPAHVGGRSRRLSHSRHSHPR